MNKQCPNEQRGQCISPRKNFMSSAYRLENTITFLASSNFWWFLAFLSFSLPPPSYSLLHCISHSLLRRTPIIGFRAYPSSVWPPPLTWIISTIILLSKGHTHMYQVLGPQHIFSGDTVQSTTLHMKNKQEASK